MGMSDPAKGSTKRVQDRVLFHYLKSPMFRTIHADGMYGGVTPQGNIHIAFYSERNPIPQTIEHAVADGGQLGDEIMESRVVRSGFVREVDIDVIVDLETAVSFRAWIDEKIKMLEKMKAKK